MMITTTATINSIDDLLRVIDDNPQYAEALRTRLLSRELIELPQTVADLAQVVADLGQRLTRLEQVVAELVREFREFVRATNERLAALEQGQQVLIEGQRELQEGQQVLIEGQRELQGGQRELQGRQRELQEGQRELQEGQRELQEGQQELRSGLAHANTRIDRLQDDVGWIKGRIIYDIVQKDAGMIAREMGLELVETLVKADLMAMTRVNDTSDIARGDLVSFHRADLVMRAADADGQMHYIAVEASFTVNGRDSRRALRNAEYLARFTGLPARSAVAGVRSDYDIHPLVAAGRLHWYEIPSEDLEAE